MCCFRAVLAREREGKRREGRRTIILAVHFSNSYLGDPSAEEVARLSAVVRSFASLTLRRSCSFCARSSFLDSSSFVLSRTSVRSFRSASSRISLACFSASAVRNLANSNSLARSLFSSSVSACLMEASIDSHSAALRVLNDFVRARVAAAVLRARVERRDWISVRSSDVERVVGDWG